MLPSFVLPYRTEDEVFSICTICPAVRYRVMVAGHGSAELASTYAFLIPSTRKKYSAWPFPYLTTVNLKHTSKMTCIACTCCLIVEKQQQVLSNKHLEFSRQNKRCLTCFLLKWPIIWLGASKLFFPILNSENSRTFLVFLLCTDVPNKFIWVPQLFHNQKGFLLTDSIHYRGLHKLFWRCQNSHQGWSEHHPKE